MILKRDGDRRVHERPPKMFEDDDYDKKVIGNHFGNCLQK